MSRDGQLQSGAQTALGLASVRGSSSRGGARALRTLIRFLRRGEGDVVMAVDGPRGPAKRAKAGAVFAARRSGALLHPVGNWAQRVIVVRSAWDEFVVPLPFSRVVIAVGEELELAVTDPHLEHLDRAINFENRRARRLLLDKPGLAAARPGAIVMTTLVMLDGELRSPEEARVSVFDRGFLFGDSVFETVRTYGGRPFRLEEHLQRLERSAGRVFIELPASLDTLTQEVVECIASAGNPESYVRIVVTRGSGPLGLDSGFEAKPTRVVIVAPLSPPPPSAYVDGIKVVTYRTQRNAEGTDAAGGEGRQLLGRGPRDAPSSRPWRR